MGTLVSRRVGAVGIGFLAFAAVVPHGSSAAAPLCPADVLAEAEAEGPSGPAVGAKELPQAWSWSVSPYRLVIPVIELDERVVVHGLASALNAGHVVNLADCDPGEPCTMYLAGHNTSHGGVFNLVDNLSVGDEVLLVDGQTTIRYTIESKELVCRHTTSIEDVATGDLVLQTSHGKDEAWILRAIVDGSAEGSDTAG